MRNFKLVPARSPKAGCFHIHRRLVRGIDEQRLKKGLGVKVSTASLKKISLTVLTGEQQFLPLLRKRKQHQTTKGATQRSKRAKKNDGLGWAVNRARLSALGGTPSLGGFN